MMKEESSLLEKKSPQNLDAEKAVIASMIIDPDALFKVADQVNIEDFSIDIHKVIAQHILTIYNKNEPVDLVTLNNSLKDNQIMLDHGGAAYLSDLTDSIPSSANIEYYLKIVRDKAELRRLIHACNDIISQAYISENEVSEQIDLAESRIFEIAQQRITSDFVAIKPALLETLASIEESFRKKDAFSGVPSGYVDLDKMLGGFQKSDLIILAARPSMGKTALCLNVTENMAIKHGKGVAFFSLEMSKQQLCQRLISSHSRIDSHNIRTGNIGKADFPKITKTVSSLSKSKIFLDDTPGINSLEVRAKARRLMAREDVDIIIIDYLQLITSADRKRSDNRQTEIAEISRSLKNLAREMNVPVIAISQLSRSVETRGGDHRPKLSDLRDSGAIEQDADVVMFIYRDEYYFPDNEEAKGKAELIIAKQRNGPTGTVQLTFNSANAKFDNHYDEV